MNSGWSLLVPSLWLILVAGCGSLPLAQPPPTPVVYPTATTPAPIATPAAASTAPALSPTVTRQSAATPIPPTATVTPPIEVEACRGGDRVVVLLLDPRVATGIRAGLDQFSGDLCKDGYTVVQRLANFAAPPDVRVYLAQLYARTKQKLDGAIVIGDLPRAYQWVTSHSTNPSFRDVSEELISFQYYTDLDGVFQTSSNYRSPGKHPFSFDVHGGNVNWEIWFGLLPLYKGDVAKTIDAVKRYFAKNHAYRLGQSNLPRAFMEISEHFTSTSAAQDAANLNLMKAGPYTWKPFVNDASARFYFDSTTPNFSLDQGYANLSAGVADFSVFEAHGSYNNSGKLTIQWVETKPVRTLFFWSDGCAVGNLDFADNFLTAVLYSPTSSVIVARGTTNNSGGMGTNQNGFYGANIASALSRKMSFGDAILSHVNVPLIKPWSDSREFELATFVTLGDPTLRLR